MAYFYCDANGWKQGPIDDQQLRELVAYGIITPSTPLETDSGHKGTAGQIPGLFSDAAPPSGNKFCTNCGNALSEQAIACMSCGAKPVGHRKFCRHCASPLSSVQVICTKCGAGISTAGTHLFSIGGVTVTGEKSKVAAGLLAILLGGAGAHKFYMGSWGWGILFLIAPPFLFFCVSVLTFITVGLAAPLFILVPSTPVIGLVEGIIYLCMSNEAFAAKYPPETQGPFRW